MKTKYYFSLLITIALITLSCKDEVETDTAEISNGAPKEIIMPRVQPLSIPTTPNMTAAPNQPVQNAPQALAQPAATAKGMNPAHGQPGHRCDIAVGAPLNSPKSAAPLTAPPKAPYTISKTPTTSTTSIPLATTPAILNPDAAPTAPGMNPPHGQAGHRCDVAVGAALPKS